MYAGFIAGVLLVTDARSSTTPMLQIIEKDAILYAPDGTRIAVPAGTELDLCAEEHPAPGESPALVRYDLGAKALLVPEPCAERPLFADGFES